MYYTYQRLIWKKFSNTCENVRNLCKAIQEIKKNNEARAKIIENLKADEKLKIEREKVIKNQKEIEDSKESDSEKQNGEIFVVKLDKEYRNPIIDMKKQRRDLS